MTRLEIRERARQVGDEVEISSTNDEWNLIVERNLLSIVRATLEEAARAVCWKCEEGEELAPRLAHDRYHYDGERCPAAPIHDLLIAGLDKEDNCE